MSVKLDLSASFYTLDGQTIDKIGMAVNGEIRQITPTFGGIISYYLSIGTARIPGIQKLRRIYLSRRIYNEVSIVLSDEEIQEIMISLEPCEALLYEQIYAKLTCQDGTYEEPILIDGEYHGIG